MTSPRPVIEIMSSGGLLVGPVPIRLEQHRILRGEGARQQSMSLASVARIQLDTSRKRRQRLILEGVDGGSMIIDRNPGASDADSFLRFIETLLKQVRQLNEFVTCVIGPSAGIRIAAWIGLATSLTILAGVIWALMSEQGLPSVLLPLAIATINLVVVAPIVLAGGPRRVGCSTFLAELGAGQRA